MTTTQRIEQLKKAIARKRETLQYADGPAYREESRRLSQMQQELAQLERQEAS